MTEHSPQTPPAQQTTPEILAPAGDVDSFLAALAAGADAIYVGLKRFSARMQAGNFGLSELARLRRLAQAKDAKVYLAFNNLMTAGEEDAAARLLDRVTRLQAADALILQDLGMVNLARQVGYRGELHLSTLANVSHPAGLAWARERLDVDRIVLPRELSVDEIKACAQACPPGLSLEVFIHGALCYAVSGRCYWSSYLGGKSGLRGRCVQPCRRTYGHRKRQGRYFACRDLRLEALTKLLTEIPEVAAWKIEGRRKGPHYVFHTVSAYRLLRDENFSPEAKKQAADYLDMALGRPGTRHRFLPQKQHLPMAVEDEAASGLMVARTPKGGKPGDPVALSPRIPLKRGDLLRVGYEGDSWHRIMGVPRDIPRNGKLDLKPVKGCKPPKPGTPVFLVDRREPELMSLLADLKRELDGLPKPKSTTSSFSPDLPQPHTGSLSRSGRPWTVQVFRRLPSGRVMGDTGLWLRPGILREVSRTMIDKVWWWLPPVVWPDEEPDWQRVCTEIMRAGARRVVVNAPWQLTFFEGAPANLRVWAGPFCNLTNPLAIEALQEFGISGAIAGPELPGPELTALAKASPVPLGVVESGLWPLCVARQVAEEVKASEPLTSPKGEGAFARKHGQNTWLYPGWPLDISAHHDELTAAGVRVFVKLNEPLPPKARSERASSEFNWNLDLT